MTLQDSTKELLDGMCSSDHAEALANTHRLWTAVRLAGRANGEADRSGVVAGLHLALSRDLPVNVCRELLGMLSEIGGDESVEPVAQWLAHGELRDDAKMALERIPGDKSLAALTAGLTAAPVEFKTSIAQSLRARGVTVAGYPCQKLVPTKETQVKAIR